MNMIKRILFYLTLSIILTAWGTGWAATYYMRVDGTAANKGAATSCSAVGTSMNIAVHNSETFSAGDIITVCDTGGDYLTALDPPTAGVSYVASGTPVIDGTTNSLTRCILLNVSDVSIDGITCQDCTGTDEGIRVYGATTGTVINNCTFKDGTGWGMKFADTAAGTFSNCTVTNNSLGGIKVGTTAGVVLIDGCTLSHNGTIAGEARDGINADSSSGLTVQNCNISYSGENGDAGHSHGIYLVPPGNNATIQNNVIYESYTGHGIACRFPTATIRYNTIYNCDASTNYAGIHLSQATANSGVGTMNVYYNVVYNNARGIQVYTDGEDVWDADTAVNIYNNTVYTGAGANFIRGIIIKPNVAAGLNIKNNLVYYGNNPTPALGQCLSFETDQTALVSDNNLLINADEDDNAYEVTYSDGGGNYTTVAAWSTASTALTGATQDAYSVESDPLFVSAATGDFHLQNGSPAIDKGATLEIE